MYNVLRRGGGRRGVVVSTAQQVGVLLGQLIRAQRLCSTLGMFKEAVLCIQWAQVFTALQQFNSSPTLQSFTRLCATPKHGWKARADATERCIRARLSMWLGGRETEVCSQVIRNSRKLRPRFADKTEQSTMRRVQYLVNMGLVSKACQALCSRGTTEITPENLAKVQGLFPPKENATCSLPTNLPEVTINQDKVKSVVLKFAKGLSPKPTGLRAEFSQHILIDAKNPSTKQLLKELANFVNYGLQGG